MKLVHNRGSLLVFLVILAVELMIALYVDDWLIRPYGGDALAVVLVYSLLRTFYRGPSWRAVLGALLIAFLVELAQYFQIVARLGLTHNSVARTVLGTSFDWGDIVAYCLGAAAIMLTQRLWLRRAPPRM